MKKIMTIGKKRFFEVRSVWMFCGGWGYILFNRRVVFDIGCQCCMQGLDGGRMSDVSERFYMKIIKRIRKKVFFEWHDFY
jgi:hypothetical protein